MTEPCGTTALLKGVSFLGLQWHAAFSTSKIVWFIEISASYTILFQNVK